MNMKTFKNLIELITSKYENIKSIYTEELFIKWFLKIKIAI